MLTRRLVYITQRDADVLAEKWLKEAMESSFTPTYKKTPATKLLDRAKRVYLQLEKWLVPEDEYHGVKYYYCKLGHQRYQEGYSLEEVVVAILLTKSVLWEHIVAKGLPSSSFELYTALDLNNQVVDYFDRAIYYFIEGYLDAEAGRKLKDIEKTEAEETAAG